MQPSRLCYAFLASAILWTLILYFVYLIAKPFFGS